MGLSEDTVEVGRILDDYAQGYPRFSIAAEDPSDRGIPPDMQEGEVNGEGWVAWRVMPSVLTEADVARIEGEFGVEFPPLFRAYLLARFQHFRQVFSFRYKQGILMTEVPSGRRLAGLKHLLSGWHPLILAGFVPFATWGDGWGPMCFDVVRRDANGDCPIVWLDHERLCTLGPERATQRNVIVPLAQPLYG